MIESVEESFTELYDNEPFADGYIEVELFQLLKRLCPSITSGIGGAAHDMVVINYNEEEFLQNATPEDVRKLISYGVFWSSEYDCLAKFV